MPKFWRPLLFFIFVAAFLISAPIVVLYTAGYRYQFGANKIVQTGILNVASFPKGASIFIDNKKQKENTPAVIDDVMPGKHIVRVQKDGYTSWQKTLEINSKQTTFADDIILFLEQAPESTTIALTTEPVINKSTKQWIYITDDGSWIEVLMKENFDTLPKSLLRLPKQKLQTYSVKWTDTNEILFIEATGTKQAKTLLNVKTDEQKPFDEKLSALSIKNLSDRSVLSIKDENNVAKIIAYLPLGSYIFDNSPNPYFLLSDTSHNRLIIIDPTQTQETILLNVSANQWNWSKTGGALLFSDGFDVAVYSPTSHRQETLTRVSEPITGLKWYEKGSVAIFASKEGIEAIELDQRSQRNKTTLVEEPLVNQFWFENDGEWIVWTIEKDSGVEVVRKRLQK
ncbi:PEGA domain-containing protein [Candidatus Uhrbacteria bacterium]|nr:PEGA domain-containing protein [Candidatus Uhrbacteria bacterium]